MSQTKKHTARMNHRYDTQEIRQRTERYSDDILFRSMCPLAEQWETALPNLGFNSVEYFELTMDTTAYFVNLGKDLTEEHVIRKLGTLHNDIRRIDQRKAPVEDTRQATVYVYFLVCRVFFSSRDTFYHKNAVRMVHKSLCITPVEYRVHAHAVALIQLPDGWMDSAFPREHAPQALPATPPLPQPPRADAHGQLYLPFMEPLDASPDDTTLATSNHIFSPRVFNSVSRLRQVHDTLQRHLRRPEESAPSERQFDPAKTQYEWLFVKQAIGEAGVVASTSRFSDVDFITQMCEWFPLYFRPSAGNPNESRKEMLRRHTESMSRERKKWFTDAERNVVRLDDMKAHAMSRGFNVSRTNRLIKVAIALRLELKELKNNIQKEDGRA